MSHSPEASVAAFGESGSRTVNSIDAPDPISPFCETDPPVKRMPTIRFSSDGAVVVAALASPDSPARNNPVDASEARMQAIARCCASHVVRDWSKWVSERGMVLWQRDLDWWQRYRDPQVNRSGHCVIVRFAVLSEGETFVNLSGFFGCQSRVETAANADPLLHNFVSRCQVIPCRRFPLHGAIFLGVGCDDGNLMLIPPKNLKKPESEGNLS
jgi:hypothetical protein